MLDIKRIRKDTDAVEAALKRRGGSVDLSHFRELESRKRGIQTDVEQLQSQRNALSKEIGQRKAAKADASDLFEQMKNVGPKLKELESRLKDLETQVEAIIVALPNTPHSSVPEGASEEDNVEVRRWSPTTGEGGEPAALDFEAKNHWEIGEDLGILDFEAGAAVAGSRFTVFRGLGARLSRALANYMLDLHTGDHGYQEVLPPVLTNAECLFGTGQLPKFEEDLFRARDDDYYMIPTAEVPVTNLVREQILEDAQLPLRMTAWTNCFRREAGAAGKDTRGLIRQHQFDKVELVQIARPGESYDALEELTGHAEAVLKGLGLAYRTVVLCGGDMGFGAAKTYDLEVWLPGQAKYREISSCSNTEDFQARRMKARFRREAKGKPELVHTLNGSGVAVGRALVAVLENYQQADGSVVVPEVLRPYMGGLEVIQAK
ncbi:serine--tRNA ligase [Magnetococcus sp. PR-3]|uniref:serine--tRNA ligase n=1 Tax=Magnetococcus sp. PR-3 TaxID=3120355 RepID=UPI002FCE3627